METIAFPYNLRAILGYIFVGVLFAIFVPITASYQGDLDRMSMKIVIAVIVMADITVICYIIIKRLLPTLRNKPALVLTSSEINFCVENKQIAWSDIQDIELREIKNKFTHMILYISLKNANSYNDDVKLDLTWIDGSPESVYQKVQNYFSQLHERPE